MPCRDEACATAHYWAREIEALGHEVRLMPPQYVKAYVKRNKNDAADTQMPSGGHPPHRFTGDRTATRRRRQRAPKAPLTEK